MCMNNNCEIKEKCLRSTATPDKEQQSYTYFTCIDEEEGFFIPNK